MKLLFSVKNQINVFTVQQRISAKDIQLLRQSLMIFFESKPAYVILDLSQARLDITEIELNASLTELKTLAQSTSISLIIAQSDIESEHAQNLVVSAALQKKVDLLERKIELQNEIKESILALKQQNEELKSSLKKQPKTENTPHAFSPLVERLWSESE
jgi:hypothetical protein